MTKRASKSRWKGLVCSECGHKFEVGEEVYSRFGGGRDSTIQKHLCESCYSKKFVDV